MPVEFADFSSALLREFAAGRATMLLSVLTLAQLALAPDPVRAVQDDVSDEHIEPLDLTDEAARLAQEYLDAAVVPVTMRSDAEHVAVAAVVCADVLVSWNFKHIVTCAGSTVSTASA